MFFRAEGSMKPVVSGVREYVVREYVAPTFRSASRSASTTLVVPFFLLAVACHPGPVISVDPGIAAGGTIAGVVRTTGGATALSSRVVTVVDVKTGEKFETTTGTAGGYTIKVPREGVYRIEVEVRSGETIVKRPEDTEINNGDLDSGRDFEITVKL
jgi:hypothetical protein